MYSPEVNARISQLRMKAAQGVLTEEECREAVVLLRQERMTSTVAAAKKRSAAAKAVRSADDLLAELGA